VEPHRIHFVGNTMIDTLVRLMPRIEASDVHERLGLEASRYILVTFHRPALVDGPLFNRAVSSLVRLSEEIPVVYPMHPRARARLRSVPEAPQLQLIGAIGYVDFLALEMRAKAVVTDSGGIQEETTYLGVPCFTLRENTERPITLSEGTNRLLGLDVDRIEEAPMLVDETPARTAPLEAPAGWDGSAGERVADLLRSALAESRGAQ
jgi:UDP-N-acetylglucosamine 2-epimerase (non-hydrolysing)